MGGVAPPYKGLPSMPMNLVSVHRFFFTAVVTFYNPSNMSKNFCDAKLI
jgi:hypothetical protein